MQNEIQRLTTLNSSLERKLRNCEKQHILKIMQLNSKMYNLQKKADESINNASRNISLHNEVVRLQEALYTLQLKTKGNNHD